MQQFSFCSVQNFSSFSCIILIVGHGRAARADAGDMLLADTQSGYRRAAPLGVAGGQKKKAPADASAFENGAYHGF